MLLLSDSDVFAGTERHIAELARALAGCGVDVRVGCPRPSPLADRATAAGVDVIAIDKRGAIDRRAIRAIAAFLRGGADRIVHCHNGRTALQAAIARSLAGCGTVVLTQHFLSPSYATRRGLKRVISDHVHAFTDRCVSHVIAISDAVRDGVLSRCEADAEGVTRVHNGMTISVDADATREAIAAKRSAIGVDASVPLVVCAARLEVEKRVGVLVAAMALVARGRPMARCVVAGDGKDRAAIQAEIDRLGSPVTLLGFRDDVRDVIAVGDVFALPAEAEPFGLVVLEAMDAGVPVIATDAGGPREIVVPGQTGWLVSPNDASSLAAAIVDALADVDRARRFGAAGRARLIEHFSADRMARETTAVYERAIASGGRR